MTPALTVEVRMESYRRSFGTNTAISEPKPAATINMAIVTPNPKRRGEGGLVDVEVGVGNLPATGLGNATVGSPGAIQARGRGVYAVASTTDSVRRRYCGRRGGPPLGGGVAAGADRHFGCDHQVAEFGVRPQRVERPLFAAPGPDVGSVAHSRRGTPCECSRLSP